MSRTDQHFLWNNILRLNERTYDIICVSGNRYSQVMIAETLN